MSDSTSRELNIVERMALVMRDMTAVGKTGQNVEQRYAFRPIDEFMNALHGPLSKHGVVCTPRVLDRQVSERDRVRNGQIVGITRVVDVLVEYTFSSPDGSTLTTVTAGEGADVADKATNKAMAGALKYAIMQTFMVPTRELVDADETTPEVPSNSSSARAERDEAADLPERAEIIRKLDEAADVLGKSRAELTKRWRAANNIGAVTQIDDEQLVPSLPLYRFVVSLQPYVDDARRKAETVKADEYAPAPDPNAVLCDATDGDKRCTKQAGHDGDHAWWG
jgi:hypothetical protein